MDTEIYTKVADFLNNNYIKKVGSELKVVNGVFINLDFWSYLRKCVYVTLGLDVNTNQDDELYKQKLEETAKQVYVAYPKALIPLIKLMLLSKGLITKTIAQPKLFDWSSSDIDADFKTGMNNLMKELGLEAKPVAGAALQILFSDAGIVFDQVSGDKTVRQIAQQINQDFTKYDSKYALQFGYARTDGICLNSVTEFGPKLLATYQLLLQADGNDNVTVNGKIPDDSDPGVRNYNPWFGEDDDLNMSPDTDLAQRMQDMLYLEGVVDSRDCQYDDLFYTLAAVCKNFKDLDFDIDSLSPGDTIVLSAQMLRLIFANKTDHVSMLAIKTNLQGILNRTFKAMHSNLAYNKPVYDISLITPTVAITSTISFYTEFIAPSRTNTLTVTLNDNKLSITHVYKGGQNNPDSPTGGTDPITNYDPFECSTSQTINQAKDIANSFGMTDGQISVSCQYKGNNTFEYKYMLICDKVDKKAVTEEFALVITTDITLNEIAQIISQKKDIKVNSTQLINEITKNIEQGCMYGFSLLSSGVNTIKSDLSDLHIDTFMVTEELNAEMPYIISGLIFMCCVALLI